MKYWKITFFAIVLSIVLTACFPTPMPTPAPTDLPTPMPTPAPTLTPAPINTPTSTPTPIVVNVRIGQPIEGAKVDQIETIKGISQNIPNGSVIWVVIFLPTIGSYYPQNFPAAVQANGDWSSVVYIGQEHDPSLKADILVVLADKNAQNSIGIYLNEARGKKDFSGLEQLPEGATIYHRISVVRK